jgi:prepilin-type N-terminal cleavage/methylation domain-containing protein
LNKSRGKNGFTLIELVVAMGILTMVFAGTVTLIIAVVNLAMSTRTKTEVVALTQKELTNTIVSYRQTPTQPIGCASISVQSLNIQKCIDSPPLSDLGDGFDSMGYVKITINTTWTDRSAPTPQTYTLTQTVRKR